MLLNPAVSNLFPNDTSAPLYKLWYTCITTSIATGVEEAGLLLLMIYNTPNLQINYNYYIIEIWSGNQISTRISSQACTAFKTSTSKNPFSDA